MFSHVTGVLFIMLIFFVLGSFSVFALFSSLAAYLDEALEKEVPKVFFNLAMILVSATFSFLYFFSPEIMGYDIKSHDLLSSFLMFLLAFVFVVACSILIFRELRRYADSFYTACFASSFASLSALLFLFSDILPTEGILALIKLFAVVSSLSLALSLLLIENDKRLQAKKRAAKSD